MPMKSLILEVEPPSPVRYLIGSAIMMIGVVLPLGYMMFRNKRVPSSSSFAKHTVEYMCYLLTSGNLDPILVNVLINFVHYLK
ncbi:hypothetical protein R6Q59_031289 [Mikania micrantha]